MKAQLSVVILGVIAVVVLVTANCLPNQSNGPTVHTASVDGFDIVYSLVSSERVGRTRFQYDYTATIINNGTSSALVSAKVSSLDPSTTVLDGDVAFPEASPGSPTGSIDAFTIEQDRTAPFQPDQLVWTIRSWTSVPAGGGSASYPVELETSGPVGELAANRIDSIVFDDDSGSFGSLGVHRFANPLVLPIDEFVLEHGLISLVPDETASNTLVSGYPAIRYTSESRRMISTFVSVGPEIVEVSWFGYLGPEDPILSYYDSFLRELSL